MHVCQPAFVLPALALLGTGVLHGGGSGGFVAAAAAAQPGIAAGAAAAGASSAATASDCVKPFCELLPCTKAVGTCRIRTCRANHGQTDCVDDVCVCGRGRCAGSDGYTCSAEQPSCQRLVGSCEDGAECDSRYGPTVCIDGRCLCAKGTCAKADSDDDDEGLASCQVVTATCVKRVGKCAVLSADGQVGCGVQHMGSECIGGTCICKEGFCSLDGVTCERGAGGGVQHYHDDYRRMWSRLPLNDTAPATKDFEAATEVVEAKGGATLCLLLLPLGTAAVAAVLRARARTERRPAVAAVSEPLLSEQ